MADRICFFRAVVHETSICNSLVSPLVLHYHAKSSELLGIVPVESAGAIQELQRVEQRIGRELPASVKQWYSQENACQLLLEYSNADPPLEISELGGPLHDTSGGGPHDLLSRNLLVFRYENQGVCIWAVQLDGSDDPAVLVDVDSQFKRWTRCADTFSEHVYSWIWDYALVLKQDRLVQAQNTPLSDQALKFLRSHFKTELMTRGWPANIQHRFYRSDQRILIWAGEDQADWWLTAGDNGSLIDLVRQIWDWDDVGKSLWSHHEPTQRLLREVGGLS